MDNEIFHIDRGNTIERVLMSDEGVVPAEDITRMVLDLGDSLVVDSAISPSAIDWTQKVTADEANQAKARLLGIKEGDPKVVFSLGSMGITAGEYIANEIVYTAAYPEGLFWDRFRLIAVSEDD